MNATFFVYGLVPASLPGSRKGKNGCAVSREAARLLSSHVSRTRRVMLKITMDSIVRRNREIVSAEMASDTVMMSIEQSAYYGINDIGTRIWQLIEHDISVRELCTTLGSEYDVSDAQCQEDVRRFLQELLDHHLVEAR
jgi:hypothetical protein